MYNTNLQFSYEPNILNAFLGKNSILIFNIQDFLTNFKNHYSFSKICIPFLCKVDIKWYLHVTKSISHFVFKSRDFALMHVLVCLAIGFILRISTHKHYFWRTWQIHLNNKYMSIFFISTGTKHVVVTFPFHILPFSYSWQIVYTNIIKYIYSIYIYIISPQGQNAWWFFQPYISPISHKSDIT